MQQAELCQDLILVGGGHAHALALRMLAMNPIAGLRITLISPASHTPYSGMLPGLIAGHYDFKQAHIDLERLCQWAGVRFIQGTVESLDPVKRILTLSGRPSLRYDVVSLDIGSEPELDSVPGARKHATPVKPVAELWQRWESLAARLSPSEIGVDSSTTQRVAVVGGGAGGVELALAMAHYLESSVTTRSIKIDLWCGGNELLAGYNPSARRAVLAAMRRSSIDVHTGSRVSAVEESCLVLEDGSKQNFSELFWCTAAAAAPWVASSGLNTDKRGFLAISDTLQSITDPSVFGVGDIATQINHPRPKAGVYAVRQAPVLAHNLRALLLGKSLRQHRPQRGFLSLVSLGDRLATANRGPFSVNGSWVWRWKDRIDRAFMARFEQLPSMSHRGASQSAGRIARDALPGALPAETAAHCGGCGAKVGAQGLAAVLAELAKVFPYNCLNPQDGDDVAQIPSSNGEPIVQSVDALRQIVADPWLMGRIAANHALSDLFASGAQPLSALATVSLPFAQDALLQRDLFQILAGALHEFTAAGCRLAGGHSMQGPELNVGFVVNGQAICAERGLLAKVGAQPGDQLVLTKALGTGVLFAAHMQHKADGRDVTAATNSMLVSNHGAAQLALEYGATACTDITGFGLAGHLLEMLAVGQSASLALPALPVLSGALALISDGITSSGHAANADNAQDSMGGQVVTQKAREALLFDPQTSGGLLIAVPQQSALELCEALHEQGFAAAGVIGSITAMKNGADRCRLFLSDAAS